jgi:hypothetical protein
MAVFVAIFATGKFSALLMLVAGMHPSKPTGPVLERNFLLRAVCDFL